MEDKIEPLILEIVSSEESVSIHANNWPVTEIHASESSSQDSEFTNVNGVGLNGYSADNEKATQTTISYLSDQLLRCCHYLGNQRNRDISLLLQEIAEPMTCTQMTTQYHPEENSPT